MTDNQTFYPTLGELKKIMHGHYYLMGARTGKILWRSWRNRSTDKYDDETICSIWSEPFTSGEGYMVWAKPAIGIFIRGL